MTPKRAEQAEAVRIAALSENPTPEDAALALALACCLLTSPVKAEREHGKALVKQWKYKTA